MIWFIYVTCLLCGCLSMFIWSWFYQFFWLWKWIYNPLSPHFLHISSWDFLDMADIIVGAMGEGGMWTVIIMFPLEKWPFWVVVYHDISIFKHIYTYTHNIYIYICNVMECNVNVMLCYVMQCNVWYVSIILYIYSTRQNYGKKTFQFTGAACLW